MADCPHCSNYFEFDVLFIHVEQCKTTSYVRRRRQLEQHGLITQEEGAVFDLAHRESAYCAWSQIEDGLFLGSISPAQDPEWIATHGVTAIVNMCGESTPHSEEKQRELGLTHYYYHNMNDSYTPGTHSILSGQFHEAAAQVTACRARGQTVLVHCAMGVSRSATVTMLHLMQHHGTSLTDAALRVRTARPCAYPNAGFWQLLYGVDHAREPGSGIKRGPRMSRAALTLHSENLLVPLDLAALEREAAERRAADAGGAGAADAGAAATASTVVDGDEGIVAAGEPGH